ncbi:MAG TPA: hypothetical protein VFZ38_09155 [Vicinamibacterales bacterium]|jgi:hypothetical protein
MPHPPRLATLLLNWLAPGNDALRGDLDEEFANGRDSRWYWRQVAALLAHEGTLRIRGRAVAGVENFVTGLITLTLVGFYAVFVVNVTDWLLRFEGVHLLFRLPDAFGPFNGVAPMLSLALGAAIGRAIATGHLHHRVAAVFVFGGTTMLCAATALKAASSGSAIFLPALMPQVATTAMFVIGLVGGITTLGLRRPIVVLGPLVKS